MKERPFSIPSTRIDHISAIYAEHRMVGFVMYIVNRGSGELYLWRFMIDQRFQGYGSEALAYLERIARAEPGIVRMKLSTDPSNANGIKVYQKSGFVDTGILDDGEEVFVKELRWPANASERPSP